ncbi:Lrp/AsnC ligand binding domain-containing protein [Arthrobacter sp. UYCo732]|uniref:Lrp/AsnC ligand binding domain-containing protein n=1 Tax=Arthrobacter sp. UYCo732 TaxID=3156336 RepID=UPI00339AB55E
MKFESLDAKIVRFFSDTPRASVLEASQGLGLGLGHGRVADALAAIPELIEVHTVWGSSDLMARIAARSDADLQRVLDAMIATMTVLRASMVIVLNTYFQGRTLNLPEAAARNGTA